MRASAITLLIATGLWAMACGSGESPGNAGPGQPLENGPYETPPSTYQDPTAAHTPSDYEKPPSIYQAPGSTPGSGSTGGESTCDVICQLAAQGCAEEQGDITNLPLGECVASCNEALGGFPCPDEFGDVVSCLLDQGITCGQLESIGEGKPEDLPPGVRNACTDVVQVFSSCAAEQTPGNDGDCTLSSQCAGCEDDCQFCRCNNLGDDGPCTACRQRNNP